MNVTQNIYPQCKRNILDLTSVPVIMQRTKLSIALMLIRNAEMKIRIESGSNKKVLRRWRI